MLIYFSFYLFTLPLINVIFRISHNVTYIYVRTIDVMVCVYRNKGILRSFFFKSFASGYTLSCLQISSLTPIPSETSIKLTQNAFSVPVTSLFVWFAPWEVVLFSLSFKYIPTDVRTRAREHVSLRFGFVARAYLIRDFISISCETK